MVKKTDLIKVQSFLKELKKLSIRVDALYLYGSRVKDTNNVWSDMDIAVVSHDFSGNPIKDLRMLLPVLKKTDVSIEVTRFRPEDFTEEHPLVWEIKHTGIRII